MNKSLILALLMNRNREQLHENICLTLLCLPDTTKMQLEIASMVACSSHYRLRRGMLFSLRLPLFHLQCHTIPFLDATLNYWLHSCWTPCECASSQLTRFRSFFFTNWISVSADGVCCLQTVPSSTAYRLG